jgi:hypothetical protein
VGRLRIFAGIAKAELIAPPVKTPKSPVIIDRVATGKACPTITGISARRSRRGHFCGRKWRGTKGNAMKNVMIIAAALALLVSPAAAQVGGKRNQGAEAPKTADGPKVDEKAYKAALERIPEPKEKYDPWGGVAPAAAPAKKTK